MCLQNLRFDLYFQKATCGVWIVSYQLGYQYQSGEKEVPPISSESSNRMCPMKWPMYHEANPGKPHVGLGRWWILQISLKSELFRNDSLSFVPIPRLSENSDTDYCTGGINQGLVDKKLLGFNKANKIHEEIPKFKFQLWAFSEHLKLNRN